MILKKVLIKSLLLVNLTLCITVWAEERLKNLEDSFWEQTNQIYLAYEPYNLFKENYKGIEYTCIPTKIIDAKFFMLEFWFWPHPYNNFLMETLKEKEDIIEDRNIKLHIANEKLKKSRKKTIIIVTAVSIPLAILSGIGGVKLGKLISK